VKLFGGDTMYNLTDAKCDELLSFIIGMVDENKSVDEMVAAVKTEMNIDVNAADVQEVARARGVTYSRGIEHVAYITKGSDKKDITALFLRMMSSDDFGETFLRAANGSSPYYAAENTTSDYQFVRSASKINANRYFSLVSTFGGIRGYRKQLNLTSFFTTVSHVPDHITSKSTATIYTIEGGKLSNVTTQVYKDAAQALINEETNNLIKNWDKYKEVAGLK
jgi:hypothetical protein